MSSVENNTKIQFQEMSFYVKYTDKVIQFYILNKYIDILVKYIGNVL